MTFMTLLVGRKISHNSFLKCDQSFWLKEKNISGMVKLIDITGSAFTKISQGLSHICSETSINAPNAKDTKHTKIISVAWSSLSRASFISSFGSSSTGAGGLAGICGGAAEGGLLST